MKGHPTLDRTGPDLLIRRTKKPWRAAQLLAGKRARMRAIAGFDGQLEVAKANGTLVEALAEDFRSAMEREHRSVYYRSNAGHTTMGVLLSLLSVVTVGVFGRLPSEALGLLS